MQALAHKRALVVIAAFGLHELTRDVVSDVLRESDLVEILIIDNGGDYAAVDREIVVRPPRNIGWLRASNVGLSVARATASPTVILLNNDTRLCEGFFAGLISAHERAPDAIIAPLYDDKAFERQYVDVPGGLQAFEGHAREVPVSAIDGTCVLVPIQIVHDVGLFDEAFFGRHGWGGMEDYSLRARQAGRRVLVTHDAYLSHATASTAMALNNRYRRFAAAEMIVGLTLKYGRHWRKHFDGEYGVRQRAEVTVAATRCVEDRLHLSANSSLWAERVVRRVARLLPEPRSRL